VIVLLQRSGDARGDYLIGCYAPLPNSTIEEWRMVVIVTGYTLLVTSNMTSYLRWQTPFW